MSDAGRLGGVKALGELLGMGRWSEETTIGEWLRGQNEEGLMELWSLILEFLGWVLERAKPARVRRGGELEVFFDNTQIEVWGKYLNLLDERGWNWSVSYNKWSDGLTSLFHSFSGFAARDWEKGYPPETIQGGQRSFAHAAKRCRNRVTSPRQKSMGASPKAARAAMPHRLAPATGHRKPPRSPHHGGSSVVRIGGTLK